MFQPQVFPVPVYLTGHEELGPDVQHVEVCLLPGTSVDLFLDPATFLFFWAFFALRWYLVLTLCWNR